jgi:hypothetical protein
MIEYLWVVLDIGGGSANLGGPKSHAMAKLANQCEFSVLTCAVQPRDKIWSGISFTCGDAIARIPTQSLIYVSEGIADYRAKEIAQKHLIKTSAKRRLSIVRNSNSAIRGMEFSSLQCHHRACRMQGIDTWKRFLDSGVHMKSLIFFKL